MMSYFFYMKKSSVDKLNIYMLSGVKEFWVIDPKEKIVFVYGFKDYKIDKFATYKGGDIFQSYS